MSLAFLLMAASSTLGPAVSDIELVQLSPDCRLIRRVEFVQPTPMSSPVMKRRPATAAAASAPLPAPKPRRPKPRRLFKIDPAPAGTEDEIICDEGAIAPLSALPPEPAPQFTPAPADSFAGQAAEVMPPMFVERMPDEPTSEAAEGPSFVSFVGGYPSAPIYVVGLPAANLAPVPEPATWVFFVLGSLCILGWKRRKAS